MIAEGNRDYARMDELMEPEIREKYGDRPTAKRVVSATAQTVSVSLGIQQLAVRRYAKKFGKPAEPKHILQAHRSGLRIAMVWANFNRHQLLSLEKKIRVFRNDHDAIEPLHTEDAFDIEEDGTVTFVGSSILDTIAGETLNLTEGRFGCPGKKYIPQLWKWTEEVSSDHGLSKDA